MSVERELSRGRDTISLCRASLKSQTITQLMQLQPLLKYERDNGLIDSVLKV